MKTVTYLEPSTITQDTEDVDFITAEIDETHKWVGRQVKKS